MKISNKSYARYILTKKWRLKRQSVLEKRGPRCEICRSISGSPDIHHLHYGTLGHERERDLQVLCRVCHEKEHMRRPKWSLDSEEQFCRYIAGFPMVVRQYRFPACWWDAVPGSTRIAAEAPQPTIVHAVKGDPNRFMVTRKPKTRPERFAVISAAGFKCEFCVKPISVGNFQVSKGKASCGCDLRADFLAKST